MSELSRQTGADIHFCRFESPVGPLLLGGAGARLEFIHFPLDGRAVSPQPDWIANDEAFKQVSSELEAYFAGRLSHFSVPFHLKGSPFQQKVWQQLLAIPFGVVKSYGDIARALGEPGASRAVGLANNANPIPIIVPCHRVIGADGKLVGFGGGMKIKIWLLEHEGITPSQVYMPDQIGFDF